MKPAIKAGQRELTMGQAAVAFVGSLVLGLVSQGLNAGPDRIQPAVRAETGIRPISETALLLLNEGRRRSRTLHDLAAAVDASDVRAYLHISSEPGIWRGITNFVSATAGIRIVNVRINVALDKLERLAVLAHELQHVREVASAPEVVNEAGMLRLFKTLGNPSSSGSRSYETRKAQEIERQVLVELAARRNE